MTETKFKKGDKVRRISNSLEHENMLIGMEFTVHSHEDSRTITFSDGRYPYIGYNPEYFELVVEEKAVEEVVYECKIGGFGRTYRIVGQARDGSYVMENDLGTIFTGQSLNAYKIKEPEPVVLVGYVYVYRDGNGYKFEDNTFLSEEEAKIDFELYRKDYCEELVEIVKVEWKERK